MKKIYVALSLLMLLMVQQGAVLHELSHVVQLAAHSDVRVESGTLATSKICELCIAYAQVSTSVSNPTSVSHFIPATHDVGPAPIYRVAVSDVLTPRSRGPPSLS